MQNFQNSQMGNAKHSLSYRAQQIVLAGSANPWASLRVQYNSPIYIFPHCFSNIRSVATYVTKSTRLDDLIVLPI